MTMETITKRQVQHIQIERKNAGIDEDTWSEMKKSVGVSSTRELSRSQFLELLGRIGRLKKNASRRSGAKPFKPVHSSAYASGMHVAPPEDRAAMLSKIEAILTDLRLPWQYADGMAKKMFGVERLRWLDGDQTYRLLQALCVYQRRRKDKSMEEENRL